MENALEVKNLTKSYDNFTLQSVSFNLPKGMIMGVIGENGAGKTTMVKAILGIINKYQGEVKIFGKNVKNYNDNNISLVGAVLDNMFFPEILTVKEVGSIMKGIYKTWDDALFQKYLEEFKLPKNKQIKTLSKGMRKKLEIASSLAHHPRLLILDEPTEGLDPIARSEVIDIFRDFIQDEECSILISSHITTDLEHLADYIIFIDEGKVLLSKTCDELLSKYGIVRCSKEEFKKIDEKDYIKYRDIRHEYDILVEDKTAFKKKYNFGTIDKLSLEDLMVLMVKGVK